jgi:hypothetical protein
MAIYLIDYENVHKNGLNGIEKLTAEDTVVIFAGNMINDMPIEIVMAILDSPAQTRIKKMKKTADNYLDFQLATCIGGLVISGEDKEFFIISNDRGYEAVIDYWQYNKASVSIVRRSTIFPVSSSGAADTAPAAAASVKLADTAKKTVHKLANTTKKTIRGIVRGEKLKPSQYTGIYNLFMNKNDLKLLHNGLVSLFEQQQGNRLYELLKGAFEQYKATA